MAIFTRWRSPPERSEYGALAHTQDIDRLHRAFDDFEIAGGGTGEAPEMRHPSLGNDFFHAKREGDIQVLRDERRIARQLAPAPRLQPAPLQKDRARGGTKKPGNDFQQCGFADAVGTHQRNHLPLFDTKAQIVEDGALSVRETHDCGTRSRQALERSTPFLLIQKIEKRRTADESRQQPHGNLSRCKCGAGNRIGYDQKHRAAQSGRRQKSKIDRARE